MPFRDLVGLDVVRADDGRVTVSLDAGDDHLNPFGTVHGGAIATLVDVAMGEAVARKDGEKGAPATIEMKVTYLEPASPGPVVAVGVVRRRGKRVTVVEAEVTQGDEVIALALATFTSG